MNPTIQEVLNLYRKGTITILHNGKIHFSNQLKEKEEVVRRQPNDSKALKNNYELIIPRFF